MNWNNLVIHVSKAQGLRLQNHKVIDVYVSMTVSGKGSNMKSKVTTNPIKTETGDVAWDEHCEFQLLDTDTNLVIHVNYKNVIGTTENLGQLQFDLTQLPKLVPLKWHKLYKRPNENKDRGQLMIAFEFSNKVGNSISMMSLNKIDKENKLDKLKRKMHIGKRKDKFDAQSIASYSMSRKSSFSSIASGLAFSPSPNTMRRPDHLNVNYPAPDTLSHVSTNDYEEQHIETKTPISIHVENNTLERETKPNGKLSEFSPHENLSGSMLSLNSPKMNLRSKVKQKAEQLFHVKHRNSGSDEHKRISSESIPIEDPTTDNHRNSHHGHTNNLSRPNSIASSSGFASLGSTALGNLNESTSPEYLLNVIAHLRKELHLKENRIQDLEGYMDKLLSRVIERNPELLQVSNPRY
uniref:FIP-RBD domain-containing protein n=1 Tax=Acrobeloides nanus TaxID=290746 RepID=A0A914C9U5_9BILA